MANMVDSLAAVLEALCNDPEQGCEGDYKKKWWTAFECLN